MEEKVKSESENKSETKKEDVGSSLKDLEKQMRFVTFLILMGVVWIKWLRYIVLWCTVVFCIWWITLPVLFFWTTDYWYLKMFGTIPFIGFAFAFLLLGLNETFKYSSKKDTVTDDFTETVKLSDELKKHEQVMRNNIETTMAILLASDKLMSSIEQIKNKNKDGKQNDITAEPKN